MTGEGPASKNSMEFRAPRWMIESVEEVAHENRMTKSELLRRMVNLGLKNPSKAVAHELEGESSQSRLSDCVASDD